MVLSASFQDIQELMELKRKKPDKYYKYLEEFKSVYYDFLPLLEKNIKQKDLPIRKPTDNLCAGCGKKIDWNKETGAFRTINKETKQIQNWCSEKCNEMKE